MCVFIIFKGLFLLESVYIGENVFVFFFNIVNKVYRNQIFTVT